MKPKISAKRTDSPVTEKPQPRNPHIFDAKTIHTSTGAGLMVEQRYVDGVLKLVLVHLGTAATIPLTVDGAKALKVLLDEWVEGHASQFWLAS